MSGSYADVANALQQTAPGVPIRLSRAGCVWFPKRGSSGHFEPHSEESLLLPLPFIFKLKARALRQLLANLIKWAPLWNPFSIGLFIWDRECLFSLKEHLQLNKLKFLG
jgi:hypothetical protein